MAYFRQRLAEWTDTGAYARCHRSILRGVRACAGSRLARRVGLPHVADDGPWETSAIAFTISTGFPRRRATPDDRNMDRAAAVVAPRRLEHPQHRASVI